MSIPAIVCVALHPSVTLLHSRGQASSMQLRGAANLERVSKHSGCLHGICRFLAAVQASARTVAKTGNHEMMADDSGCESLAMSLSAAQSCIAASLFSVDICTV
jgi:hypothetical protein